MEERIVRIIRRGVVLSNIERLGFGGVIISSTAHDAIFALTGFKCSNCILVISRLRSLFATDQRYIEQAKEYLPKEFAMEYPQLAPYICQEIVVVDMQSYNDALFAHTELCYDSMLHTIADIERYEKLFSTSKLFGVSGLIKSISNGLMPANKDEATGYISIGVGQYDQEGVLYNLVQKHGVFHQSDVKKHTCYSIQGYDINAKIQKVLERVEGDFLFSNNPDEICWLLNIRGNGSLYTPVIYGYLFLGKCGCYLFTDFVLPERVEGYINMLNLSEMEGFCSKIADKNIELDPKYAPAYFLSKFSLHIRRASIIEQLKAIKTPIEIENIRKAHIIDGAAISKLICWLYEHVGHCTELSVSEKLLEIRISFKEFISNSFETISAFGSNSSMIHYHIQHETKITRDGLYLLDAGGQYFHGTTDMTRTMCFGIPTNEQKRMFTLVLKGHIRIAQAVFPEGTSGSNLDALARMDLWKEFADYGHGTGHGVGYLLSVHEGPQSINMRNNTKLEEGMVLSNEPGFYKEGEYGIRIENMMYIKRLTDKFLCFETLTVVPILHTLIDFALLTEQEINWLKEYNANALSAISQYLSEKEQSFFMEHSLLVR